MLENESHIYHLSPNAAIMAIQSAHFNLVIHTVYLALPLPLPPQCLTYTHVYRYIRHVIPWSCLPCTPHEVLIFNKAGRQ